MTMGRSARKSIGSVAFVVVAAGIMPLWVSTVKADDNDHPLWGLSMIVINVDVVGIEERSGGLLWVTVRTRSERPESVKSPLLFGLSKPPTPIGNHRRVQNS